MQVPDESRQIRKIADVNPKESAGRALLFCGFVRYVQIYNALFCGYSAKKQRDNAENCLTCA